MELDNMRGTKRLLSISKISGIQKVTSPGPNLPPRVRSIIRIPKLLFPIKFVARTNPLSFEALFSPPPPHPPAVKRD